MGSILIWLNPEKKSMKLNILKLKDQSIRLSMLGRGYISLRHVALRSVNSTHKPLVR